MIALVKMVSHRGAVSLRTGEDRTSTPPPNREFQCSRPQVQ